MRAGIGIACGAAALLLAAPEGGLDGRPSEAPGAQAPAGAGDPQETAGAPSEAPLAAPAPAPPTPHDARGASSWTAATRQRMVADAVKVAPPALAHVVLSHRGDLLAGLKQAGASEGSAPHRQDGDDPTTGAAGRLAEWQRRAVEAIDGHLPMTEVVYRLGVVAHLAADLNDPLLTSASAAGAAFASDFGGYVERNAHRFPAVFYGYEPQDEAGAPPPLGSARRARGYLPHVERAYAAAGGSSPRFDVRSIPFGVASICYSRAVTEIARAWLHVWREARGDLTGTPYLAGAPPAPPVVAAGTSAASRPPRPAAPPLPLADAAADPALPPADGVETRDEPPAPITKTIYGKSRKRQSKGGAADPNASPPAADPKAPPAPDQD